MRLLLALAAGLLLTAPVAEAAKKAPKKDRLVSRALPAGHTKVAIGQTSISHVDAFAREAGVDAAAGMWYLGLYEDPADVTAVLDEIRDAVATHPGLEVTLGISFGSVSTPNPPYTPAIAAGVYDDRIRLLANRLKALGVVAHLRLGYEFDLLGGQYGPAEAYKAAYRHTVDVLRAEGVRNAVYVWHSAGAFWRATDPSVAAVMSGEVGTVAADTLPAAAADPQPISAFYPGREYVDAFGISYWGDSCCFGRSSPKARALYERRTREILDRARGMGLPLTIGESTPAYVGASSRGESIAWLDRAFDLIEEYDIRLWSLISQDWREGGFFAAPFWNGYWPDARISRYRAVCEAFLARGTTERYLYRTAERRGCSSPRP